jgi:aldehyde dehydrogenase family 7 protein A1
VCVRDITYQIVQDVLTESGYSPAIASLMCGRGGTVGDLLVKDRRMELVSFTGSTQVRGRRGLGMPTHVRR